MRQTKTLSEISKTHWLCFVKRNDGKAIRLALLADLILESEKRTEFELRGLQKEEFANPCWQTHKVLWWHPASSFWYEATQDDAKAKEEVAKVIANVHKFPDKAAEQEILLVFENNKFKIVDGNLRTVTIR
jgi:hypothetical protein